MSDLAIASTESDAHAAHAVETHHAQMSGALAVLTEEVVSAAARGDLATAEQARHHLVSWCREELLPHAAAEEQALYPPARALPEGRLLVDGMLDEHRTIGELVDRLASSSEPVRAAGTAASLRAVFESHLAKENELVLPLLVSRPDVSVSDLLEGMHQVLGGESSEHAADESAGGGCSGGTCTCGEQDTDALPELDVRAIPHAIRHATVLGALGSVVSGGGIVLVAPHDPKPLLRQVQERWPDAFGVDYLETGPDAWRLALLRR